jgi:hypothetical protein
MREQADLPAMVRVMGNHVGEHSWARTPGPCPAIAKKNVNPAFRARLGFEKHLAAARGAVSQRSSGLLLRASASVQESRYFQVRSRQPQPLTADIVHMRKDPGNRAYAPARGLRPPRPRVEVLQDELVHEIIHGVGLNHLLNLVRAK